MSESHALTSPFAAEVRMPVDSRSLPPSLQILLDDGLYNRMKQLAGIMAKSEGLTPRHLIGKPEACFTVIQMSLDWRMNPNFVARLTYQTPGGSIGFMGALIQGALENSGRFVGAPEFEYVGNWQAIAGKFEKKVSSKGNEFVVPKWTTHDATGLGIIIRWQVKGEKKVRVWPGENSPFFLTQCYPLNSPLWATDPKTQIAYLAIRRFANQVAPGILGAAAFDADEILDASERAKDVTPPPRPTREQFTERNLGPNSDGGSADMRPWGVEPDPSPANAPKPVIPGRAGGKPAHPLPAKEIEVMSDGPHNAAPDNATAPVTPPGPIHPAKESEVMPDSGDRYAFRDNATAPVTPPGPIHPLSPSGDGSTSTNAPTGVSAEGDDAGDLPDHVTVREEGFDEDTNNDPGETFRTYPPERDPFWDQERLYLAPIRMPKSDKTDWSSTYVRLMELIKEVGSAGELMRFQADSRRTIQGVQLATKSTAVMQAIAARLAELPQDGEDG